MHEPVDWPEYCCAILRDEAGRFWLEQRPAEAAVAAGQVTCFGGRREAGEHPDACVRRELMEELGFAPEVLIPRVRLFVGDRLVAWFYAGAVAGKAASVRTEPGRLLRVVGPEEIGALPLSAWHRAAIEAYLAGAPVARVKSV